MFNQVIQPAFTSAQLDKYSSTPTQLINQKSSPLQNLPMTKSKRPLLRKQFNSYQHYQFGSNNNMMQLLNSNLYQQDLVTPRTNNSQLKMHIPAPINLFIEKEINYRDDDEIQMSNNLKKATYDLDQDLQFQVKCQRQMVNLLQDKTYQMPAIVSIQTKENAKNIQDRAEVDLICLIDVSGSMEGMKLEMVKTTLIQLLQFLGSQDRFQLISFNSDAERLTPLKKVSKENKQYFERIISGLTAGGGTTIGSATEIAFKQVQKRKYRNNVTSIFLLSDGQDDDAYGIVAQQIKQCNEVFTLHSFGFGKDHDAKLMTSLCNLGKGSFYFVQEISLLDECFVDALGGLMTVVGEELEINISCHPLQPYQNTQIIKTYGNMWKCQRERRDYTIKIPVIASGSRKDYVFKIEFPELNFSFRALSRQATIIEASLSLKNPITKQIVIKKASLKITFNNPDEQIQANDDDVDVMTQYYRVKAADIIDDARRACDKEQFKEAQMMIEKMLLIIQSNKHVALRSTGIIQDLQQAKSGSQKRNYLSYGQSHMRQIVFNSYQQSGVNAVFSENGKQIQLERPAFYSNNFQTTLVQTVQASKGSKQI